MREALELLDAAASLASLAGSFLCVYLMQAALCDRRRFMHIQRMALGALAIALAGDALAPDWASIGGIHPAGAAVDFALFANLAIMAARSRRKSGTIHNQEMASDAPQERRRRVPG